MEHKGTEKDYYIGHALDRYVLKNKQDADDAKIFLS
jgi:hypothetical protein